MVKYFIQHTQNELGKEKNVIKYDFVLLCETNWEVLQNGDQNTSLFISSQYKCFTISTTNTNNL